MWLRYAALEAQRMGVVGVLQDLAALELQGPGRHDARCCTRGRIADNEFEHPQGIQSAPGTQADISGLPGAPPLGGKSLATAPFRGSMTTFLLALPIRQGWRPTRGERIVSAFPGSWRHRASAPPSLAPHRAGVRPRWAENPDRPNAGLGDGALRSVRQNPSAVASACSLGEPYS